VGVAIKGNVVATKKGIVQVAVFKFKKVLGRYSPCYSSHVSCVSMSIFCHLLCHTYLQFQFLFHFIVCFFSLRVESN
jgi:hypothetical protein